MTKKTEKEPNMKANHMILLGSLYFLAAMMMVAIFFISDAREGMSVFLVRLTQGIIGLGLFGGAGWWAFKSAAEIQKNKKEAQ